MPSSSYQGQCEERSMNRVLSPHTSYSSASSTTINHRANNVASMPWIALSWTPMSAEGIGLRNLSGVIERVAYPSKTVIQSARAGPQRTHTETRGPSCARPASRRSAFFSSCVRNKHQKHNDYISTRHHRPDGRPNLCSTPAMSS